MYVYICIYMYIYIQFEYPDRYFYLCSIELRVMVWYNSPQRNAPQSLPKNNKQNLRSVPV